MFLTLAAFVGLAVVLVGLYVFIVLKAEVREALEDTLKQRAQRIALIIEQAETREEREDVVQSLAQYADIRISILDENAMIWDAIGNHLSLGAMQAGGPPLERLIEGGDPVIEVYNEGGIHTHFVTLRLQGSRLSIRVGQPSPPLLGLVQQMRTTLIVGMIMALFLALLGSWISAQLVTVPLQKIRKSARSISEGDLDSQILVDSRASELQDLTSSLNRMSDSFKEKIENLERMASLQNEFIGNVSHEVRNPIFAVGGFLEALAVPGMSDAQRELYAEKALANLQRLTNLFNDLIEIARLEYREDLVHREPFNISQLIEEVVEVLRPKAGEKNVYIDVRMENLDVDADRNRIRQVLINLVENAIAYSDSGTITVDAHRHGDKVRIEIDDEGRGMSPEHLERIFDRFYRVDPDRSRKSGGTGLGLSIVKQILQAHGEPIVVESHHGVGSRFQFELPYALPINESDAVEVGIT
ncbi:MAG: HAMP domain-containing protein [Rhodothermales bacterium]|nr:HAMP domain-containing protein [Rhodothermales bacterium]